jgi:hypothetical protein
MTTVSILAGLGGSGYKVSNSLRFRSSATAYLNRTMTTATNQYIYTWSGWVKRGQLGVTQTMFEAWAANTNTQYAQFTFNSSDALSFGGWTTSWRISTQLFRDPSAWYHLVLAVDTTQATAANRIKIYVNGSQITSFSTSNDPPQNNTTGINTAILHKIGQEQSAQYFDGYLAEVNFVDGQQLTASSFGTYDANGVWQPINYSGTYGTNGFHLTFSNTTSTATLGNDTSGNSNTWTVNNISLTAGATYDSMTDSPTVSSATVANYCTLNPLAIVATGNPFTVSNGNLTYSQPTDTAGAGVAGTFFVNSGKWYWEGTVQSTSGGAGNSTFTAGLLASNFANGSGTPFPYRYIGLGTTQSQAGVSGPTLSSYGAGDTVMVALDVTGSKLYFGKNGVWGNSAVPASGTGACFTDLASYTYFTPAVGNPGNNSTSFICNMNFGQQPFLYTPPTGFSALNTYNLPTPTVNNGALYMAATTYTGNGTASTSILNSANNTIGTTFAPNFVWIKSRSAATNHYLYDTLRGANNQLLSNATNTESTVANRMTAFNSNGFTLGSDTEVNASAATYVGWQWLAGTASGVSNTSGSITSTVSANTTAGFSVVTYTGTGANATVGHGLGVAPSMIIMKNRQAANSWVVYHVSTGNGNVLILNSTNASTADSTAWNTTTPTSSVFSLGSGAAADTNQTTGGGQHVAYCFAAVSGYSAFGSYTGNGSTDGPFIYTGFRPRFVMTKRTDSTSDWLIFDTSRNTYNVANSTLLPDSSAAEITDANRMIDFVSNGFKVRSALAEFNGSGNNMIYVAFAENPFTSSRAR